MRHTLAVLVLNQPGVLMRVAGMFSRRGFNIESLAVGVTETADCSRITAVMQGDAATVKQVVKQLEKLVEVKAVAVLPPEAAVVRGLALIKVRSCSERRLEILKLAEVFRAKAVDVAEESLTLELTGDEEKINAFLEVLAPYQVLEMARTGVIGLQRGECALAEASKDCQLTALLAAEI